MGCDVTQDGGHLGRDLGFTPKLEIIKKKTESHTCRISLNKVLSVLLSLVRPRVKLEKLTRQMSCLFSLMEWFPFLSLLHEFSCPEWVSVLRI